MTSRYNNEHSEGSRSVSNWALPLGLVVGGILGVGIALLVGGTDALVNGMIFGAGFGLVFGLGFTYISRRLGQS